MQFEESTHGYSVADKQFKLEKKSRHQQTHLSTSKDQLAKRLNLRKQTSDSDRRAHATAHAKLSHRKVSRKSHQRRHPPVEARVLHAPASTPYSPLQDSRNFSSNFKSSMRVQIE